MEVKLIYCLRNASVKTPSELRRNPSSLGTCWEPFGSLGTSKNPKHRSAQRKYWPHDLKATRGQPKGLTPKFTQPHPTQRHPHPPPQIGPSAMLRAVLLTTLLAYGEAERRLAWIGRNNNWVRLRIAKQVQRGKNRSQRAFFQGTWPVLCPYRRLSIYQVTKSEPLTTWGLWQWGSPKNRHAYIRFTLAALMCPG